MSIMTAPPPAPSESSAFEVVAPLRQDLEGFGFKTFRQYRHWCATNGLVDGLKRGKRKLPPACYRDHNQDPALPPSLGRQQFLEQIATDRYPYDSWHTLAIKKTLGDDREKRQALLRLLLHIDRFMNVMRSKKFYNFGSHKNLMYGLLAIAYHHQRWLRPLEDWSCEPCINGHPRPTDQFSSLLRHLLARFEAPCFMDVTFFEGSDEHGLALQKWFISVANGGNIRDFDLPIKLTKRMGHALLTTPNDNRFSIERNLRWAQVKGMGGDAQLAKTVLHTRLGRNFEDDEFWGTVVLFLANNAMMDPEYIGPLIDYVHNMKFAPRRIVSEDGGIEEAPPPQPDFTMKGRSATKLLRQVDAWHGHLSREQDVIFESWPASGLRAFELEEEVESIGLVRWTVQELLSSWELSAEGRAMDHCVVSYSNQCANGKTSIWSIALQRWGRERRENVLTVAVDVKSKTITQARGRYNMQPSAKSSKKQQNRADLSSYVIMLNRSAHVLKLWAERAQLLREV
ncbi:MAG: PcfJ domain-containing protein [Candidatus Latescibacterota bacterium]|jgi:hypothetical protein